MPERIPRVAVLDGGPARQEEDGGQVIGENDAGERCGDLRKSELLAGEEVEEKEPRWVVGRRGGGGDEEAVRIEEGAAGWGQMVGPGEAEAMEAPDREVEDCLREGRQEGNEEERRLRGEDRAGRREEGAVGTAGCAQGEEILEGCQAA